MTKEFAKILARFKKANHVDTKILAQQSGVSTSHIRKLCSGDRNTSYATATRIARALGIPDRTLPKFRSCAMGKRSSKRVVR